MEETVNVQELLNGRRGRAPSRSAKVSLGIGSVSLGGLVGAILWLGSIHETVKTDHEQMKSLWQEKASKESVESMKRELSETHEDVREIRRLLENRDRSILHYNPSSKADR